MTRTYALRGDIVVREANGRESTVEPADWADVSRRWVPALDSTCQPRFVDRDAVRQVGEL